jgi:hypothetical protein
MCGKERTPDLLSALYRQRNSLALPSWNCDVTVHSYSRLFNATARLLVIVEMDVRARVALELQFIVVAQRIGLTLGEIGVEPFPVKCVSDDIMSYGTWARYQSSP